MNLIIDCGNTRIKLAVFNKSKLIYNEAFTADNFVKVVLNCIDKFNCKHAIISSVGAIKIQEINKIKEKITLIELNSSTKIPFLNKYSTPKTLGVDRIGLVAAAVSQFPKTNVLVIDAGTCITYDFVDANANYSGGAISPGIKIRYKSLNKFTKKLPLLEPDFDVELIGDSTEKSIHSGIAFGILGEIDSIIKMYKNKNEDLTVVLTGGDVKFLSNKLKNSIFANSNFLLEGLNSILTYNLK
ncbi:type III pantothenate kinase [Lutibacter maritimus]|uniref:Type III pantothenate kinase n=1 Tax=Lutibacter maritimus TaxID=593133 RepID=A0A1I6R2S8_9FLAO|nr:type III pantothenate kinase [Lutibacter maritimus]SFS59037.1 type III pantothenate kinase [Lutibacter maritimus]